MNTRPIYQALKWYGIFKAAKRGPRALAQNRTNAIAIKTVSRVVRRAFK